MIGQAIFNLRPGQGYNIDGDVENEQDYKKKTSWLVGTDENNTAIFGKFDSIKNTPTWAEIQAEIKRITPMAEWEEEMKQSDSSMMPRAREHAITKIDKGVADNDEEQKRYDEKIALRAKNPSTV